MANERSNNSEDKQQGGSPTQSVPQIALPKGGGAIRSIDDKFSVNAVNGTSGFSIPFPFSPSRNSFLPSLSLGYNSGSGNSVFGLGWSAETASIARKTDKRLPEYRDEEETDIFIISGSEDMVPAYVKDAAGNWTKDVSVSGGNTITRYRPRIESSFARIEKVKEANGNVYWRSTSGANIVSVFGKSPSAQVADPADPSRIFKWLFEFSYDDKGNCFQLEYKKEDKTNLTIALHERNRLNDLAPFTNTYLKRIKYCNKVHFQRSTLDFNNWDASLKKIDYLLELVLDYGEHDASNPQPDDDRGWPSRVDAFSDYRAGFEIRTYRLCRRLLMFHLFTELGTTPCLVNSMDIEYQQSSAFTFLLSVTPKGYIRKADGSYSTKGLPPVEFNYEQLTWNTEIKALSSEGLENLPVGIDGTDYQWVDLYHEGVSGILSEQGNAWYYKSNAGDGRFETQQLVSPKPQARGLATGDLNFGDIEGDGRQFLIDGLRGFYELSDEGEWLPYKTFTEVPGLDPRDPNIRLLDLDGDGRTDILLTEEELFTWYPSKGKEGFEAYRKIPIIPDEEKAPALVFADSTESILLADMNGNGLTDIVRIRYHEVSYWPNLGYGKFGAKVSMSNAPFLDRPEEFNPRYLVLADVDGSGTTDIVYLGRDSFKVYFNQAGNSWSDTNTAGISGTLLFPQIGNHSIVSVIDLLGTGTGCIVWSSSLPQHTGSQLQYIDLLGGKKPYIMNGYKNNMGKEVKVEYKPSTFYYLEDKKAGTPWATKLPFPVYCVDSIETLDKVSKVRFVSRYSYHHGYYDHPEREFRGFGRVDQTDTEDFELYKKNMDPHGGGPQLVDEGFHQPPVLTRTWYHTGAFLDNEKILSRFSHEYYSNNVVPEKELDDPLLPDGLTIDEWREAQRACKGLPLRTELYSKDGSDRQDHPYATSHYSCVIRILQPRLGNPFAVFLAGSGETLNYNYERDPSDPRIAHALTLEIDDFGNISKAATVKYGRKKADPALLPAEQAEQSRTHVVYTMGNFTNAVDTAADYHLPGNFETMTYELTGLTPDKEDYFTIAGIKTAIGQSQTIPYEAQAAAGKKQLRLIEQTRNLFLKNDLSGPLAPGVLESLALPYQVYRLSLTPGLRDLVFGDKITDALLLGEGKYVHFNDGNYWICSGTQTLDPANFYQVKELTDPFGLKFTVTFDDKYRYFVQQTTDELGNTPKVLGFNYRTLTPWLMSDLNDNRAGSRSDELGMVSSTFLMGKEGENNGDPIDASTPENSPDDQPTTTLEYNLFNYRDNGKPNLIKTSVRETHYYDSLKAGVPSVWQTSYAYSDGNGNTVMQKTQAEPGMALVEKDDGTVTEVDTTPDIRWVGNGRTILNNKGLTVKRYEPYFSTTFEFEDAKELVERGVTPVITYDPTGRAIRTDSPDGSFIRMEVDAWTQRTFDPNDTVLDSQWYKDRITTPVAGVATPEEIDAAKKAAAHANTPGTTYLDSLGGSFLSVTDNGNGQKFRTLTLSDIEGNVLSVTDPAGNAVMQYKYDMLGAQLYMNSMDAGERWILNDVMGRIIRGFDSRDHRFRYEYDKLHRPVKIFVQQGSAAEINTEKIVYGEGIPNDRQLNMRGKPYRQYDTAGITTSVRFDFKSNSLEGNRQLLKDYKNTPDWNTLTETVTDLDAAIYTTTGSFDAMNRPLLMQLPEGTVIRPSYNEGGIVDQVFVNIKGTGEKQFLKNIDYDAKGQRQRVICGNDTATSYQYDPKTLRLRDLLTTGKNGTDLLQKLHFTYDPKGNITAIRDEAQSTVFFDNAAVSPSRDYTYDALYQLKQAAGREHAGQNFLNESATNSDLRNFPFQNSANSNDTQALRLYTQKYSYDAVGNMTQLQHIAGAGSYTRTCRYNNNDVDRQALGIPADKTRNNQLLSSTAGDHTTRYDYDAHGNMLNLAQLQSMTWNFKEELQQVDLGGGGKAYYVYDSNGQRIRKVIERLDGSIEERIYFGQFEIYRRTDSGGGTQERTETIHIEGAGSKIATVETKTVEDGIPSAPGNLQPLIRYQYGDHQGSASLELDDKGILISYEEYHPFGTTAFTATNKDIKAAYKRYRYTGMERDEESGLEYHSARYYLPWLSRWLSCDPIGIKDGVNIYLYCQNDPIGHTDPNGKDSVLTYRGYETVNVPGVKDIHETGTETNTVYNEDQLYDATIKTVHGTGWRVVGDHEEKVNFQVTTSSIHFLKTGKTFATDPVISLSDPIEKETRSIAATAKDLVAKKAIGKIVEKDVTRFREKQDFTINSAVEPKVDWGAFFNRVMGGLRVAFAALEIAGGWALCSTGVGCAVGGFIIAHGIDQGIAGGRSLIDGDAHRSFTSEYLLQKGLGFSETGAEIGDMALSMVGGAVKVVQKSAQWAMKPLVRAALRQPWEYGSAGGAGGITNWAGKITIPYGTVGKELYNARVHEGFHALLSVAGEDALSLARQGAKKWGYQNVQFVRWLEEFGAHSLEFGSFKEGYEFLKFPYVRDAIYGLNYKVVAAQGIGIGVGYTGLFFGTLKLSDNYFLKDN